MSSVSASPSPTPPATPASSASSHAAGTSASAASGANGQRRPPADLFATLLALVASADAPVAPGAALTPGGDTASPDDPGSDPLHTTDPSLPPWAGWLTMPLPRGDRAGADLAGLAGRAGGANDTALPTTATTPSAAGPAGTDRPGIDVSGLTPTSDAAAPKAPPALGRGGIAPGAGSHPGQAPAHATAHAHGLRWQRADGATGPAAHQPGLPATAAPRATVALDERFAAQQARASGWLAGERGPAAADSPVGEGPRGVRGGLELPGGSIAPAAASGDAGTAGAGADTLAGREPTDASTPDTASADTPPGDAAETTEVQHWGDGALRHASLRVGDGDEASIDIRLRVQGQEVQLDFRTDDAQAREQLMQDAAAALGERLAQAGIDLGQVSVGSHGGSAAGGQGFARDERPTAARAEGRRAGPAPVNGAEREPTPVARPPVSGAPGRLDLYA